MDHLSLLNPLDLDEAVGDSPMFRQRLHSIEEEVEETQSKLKKLSRLCKQAVASAHVFASDYRAVATEMMGFSDSSDNGSLESCMRRFGECLEALDNFQAQMASQMNLMLVGPIEQFIQKEVGRVKDSSKRCESMKQKYSQALSRFSSTPSDSPKFHQLGEQLSISKMEYINTSLEYVMLLNEFEVKKRTDLLECMVAFMFTQSAYFHQGYELLKDFDPFLRKTGEDLDKLRSKSTEDRQTQLTKKNELTAKSAAIDVTSPLSLVADETTAHMQGYLFSYEKSGRSKNWKRRYFILREGRLNYYKDDKSIDEPSGYLDMIVSTVKTTVSGVKRDFLFEVISPASSFMLQAENQAEKDRWVQVIQNAISSALSSESLGAPSKKQNPSSHTQSETPTKPGQRPRSASYNHAVPALNNNSQEASEKEALLIELSNLHASNRQCVDCGRKNPTWASINLCALLCIQCSGIHRSLGTHITKVRSLTLDKWESETRQLFKLMNNDKVNQVYEAALPADVASRISENSSRAELEEFIKAKYVRKLYLEPFNPSHVNVELQKAVRQGLLLAAFKAIARGADPNAGLSISSPLSSTSDDVMSAIHWASKSKQLAILELLLWNGAKPGEVDYQGRTGLHHAAKAKFLAGVVVLLKHGSNGSITDVFGKTALDYAVEMQLADMATLLRLAQLAESEKSAHSRSAFEEALQSYEYETGKEVETMSSGWSSATPSSPRTPTSPKSDSISSLATVRSSENIPVVPSSTPVSMSPRVGTPPSSSSPTTAKKVVQTPVNARLQGKPRSATMNDLSSSPVNRPEHLMNPVNSTLQSFAPPAGWKLVRTSTGSRSIRVTLDNPEDYANNSPRSPRACHTCSSPVPFNEQVAALNRVYHVLCIRCDTCKVYLDMSEAHLGNERVLCASCMDAEKRASIILPSVMPALPVEPPSQPMSVSTPPYLVQSPTSEPEAIRPSSYPRVVSRGAVMPRRLQASGGSSASGSGSSTPSAVLPINLPPHSLAQSASGSSTPTSTRDTQTPTTAIDAEIEDAILDELARLEIEEARSKNPK